MKKELNIIRNLRDKNIITNLSLEDLVRRIKDTSDPLKNSIYNKAREEYSLNGKSDKYNDMKVNSFMCFIPNFTFKDYVKGSNLLDSTGYLYIDVDNVDTLDIDLTYVVAYWKSLSNNGYSVILSVDGLTKENLLEATKYASQVIGVDYDSSAVSVDRNVIISLDPNAYYSNSFSTLDLDSVISNNYSVEQYNIPRERERVTTVSRHKNNNKRLKTSTLDDLIAGVDFREKVVVDLGMKVKVAKVGVNAIKVPVGSRNSSLFFMSCQIKALNEWAQFEDIIPYMREVNRKGMRVPVSESELIKIVNNALDKYSRGDLKIVYNSSRRFLFNPEFELTAREKRSIVMKIINETRKANTKRRVYRYIRREKTTHKKLISERLKLSLKTTAEYVNKYLIEEMFKKEGEVCYKIVAERVGIKEHTAKNYIKELGL